MSATLETSGRRAVRPESRAAHPPFVERAVEELLGNRLGADVYARWVASLSLAGDERVLEIGTGAGACARHLARSLPHGRLTCLDVDERWLTVARRRLSAYAPRIDFVCADAAEWSRPGAFDVAVAHFVLHDMPAPARASALDRIAESLGAGGCLCLREPLGHGMSKDELLRQLWGAGFEKAGAVTTARVPLMGPTMSGVWQLWA